MSGALLRYDAACRAVAEARTVDEAKDVRDKAEAVRIYARQAKNRDLEVDAAEIRLRAERRLGALLAEKKQTDGLASGGQHGGRTKIDGSRAEPSNKAPTLADLGVDKKLSSRAQQIAAVPAERFERDVAEWRERVGRDHERVTLDIIRGADKKERRAERERELGAVQAPTGKFGVIVEDYEWDYEVWSRETGMDRHAANHYPVSVDAHLAEEIVARTKDRFAVAADNCLLAMWSTVPHLAIAIDVLRLRGFRYVSHYAWGKDRAGTGHWNRNRHEILLLGVKGVVPCPAPGTQWDSLIPAAVGEHSEKPACFLEMLEGYFPTLPKIELNARRVRPGWTAWGLEAPPAPRLDVAALLDGLAGVAVGPLNARLHVAAMAKRAAAGGAIEGLDAQYLAAIAAKCGVVGGQS